MKKCIALLFIALSCSHLKAQRIISFFNEQKSPELVKLFKDSSLIPNLQAIHGEIRMGTLDLNAEPIILFFFINYYSYSFMPE